MTETPVERPDHQRVAPPRGARLWRGGKAASAFIGVILLAPGDAVAQVVSGTAEWTVAKDTSATTTQSSGTTSLWQNYVMGLGAALIDPRLVAYDAELSFRTNTFTGRRSNRDDQQGRRADVGFKLGASVFPLGHVPVFIRASRVDGASSGDLGPSNPIRSGMTLSVDTPLPDFKTRSDLIEIRTQVTLERLPRVELAYRKNSTLVTGASQRAERDDDNLRIAISRDTGTVRQSFRYQRTSYQNTLTQTFTQDLGNIDYDVVAAPSGQIRLFAHVGRRHTFVRSMALRPLLDAERGPYALTPSVGHTASRYLQAGVSYEPGRRMSLRLDGNTDLQRDDHATMSGDLITATAHLAVVPGLSVNMSGTTGRRVQRVGNPPLTVLARSALATLRYLAGPSWLSASVSVTRGIGFNVSPEGHRGRSQKWSHEVSLSSAFRSIGLGSGYERVTSRDGVLDYGNYDSQRLRASAQAQTARLTLTTSVDQLRVRRGVGATLASNRQRTFAQSATFRLRRESSLSLTAGGFSNVYSTVKDSGRDRAFFWGGRAQVSFARLRLLAWTRQELITATATRFSHRGHTASARIEYRLRATSVAFEYRHTASSVQYAEMIDTDWFRGHQVRFTLSRHFGFQL